MLPINYLGVFLQTQNNGSLFLVKSDQSRHECMIHRSMQEPIHNETSGLKSKKKKDNLKNTHYINNLAKKEENAFELHPVEDRK